MKQPSIKKILSLLTILVSSGYFFISESLLLSSMPSKSQFYTFLDETAISEKKSINYLDFVLNDYYYVKSSSGSVIISVGIVLNTSDNDNYYLIFYYLC